MLAALRVAGAVLAMFVFNTDDIITSRQNRRIVELMKLDDRRTREATRCFRFDGVKLLCEAIRRGVKLETIYLRVGTAERVVARMEELYHCTPSDAGCPIFGVENSLFEKISQENAPDGVITVARYLDKCHKMSKIYNKDEFEGGFPADSSAPIILLESVRDPLNVGAIIRSAAALGIGGLIMSADCADVYNPRTVRAAMGTLFALPILRVEDLVGTIRALRAEGRRIYAAALDETAARLDIFDPRTGLERNAHSPKLSVLSDSTDGMAGGVAAVIGNEGHGLSDAVIHACDRSIYIPMQADTESLNAGVAAALIMWELCRA